MAEFSLIERFCKGIGKQHPETKINVGDDAAIIAIPEGMELAISVDSMVSGVHFFPDTSPANIAHKLLAVNVSDMAAMGAQPKWATMTLTIPKIDNTWLSAFSSSLNEQANVYGVQLIGGDTTEGDLNLSMQIIGLTYKSKALSRSGAMLKDDLYLSNNVGDAALALDLILRKKQVPTRLLNALEKPSAQVELGLKLANIANACIDVSDGVVADFSHIANQSGVSVVIDVDQLPLSTNYLDYIKHGGSVDLALTGGDDYQLAFTASRKHREALEKIAQELDIKLSRVGHVIEKADSAVYLTRAGKPYELTQNSGYQHFNNDSESS